MKPLETLNRALRAAVEKHFPQFTDAVEFEPAANIRHGDWASVAAFNIGRGLGLSPHAVATTLAAELNDRLAKRASFSVLPNAPYINARLANSMWRDVLAAARETSEQLTDHSRLFGYVVVEFISANPTGPLTLANGRGGFYGDALANILEAVGAKVEREYYFNDSGNQIMALGRSVEAARLKSPPVADGYTGPYIQEIAARIPTFGDPYDVGRQAADMIFNDWIKPAITRMGVTFTRYTSEQSLVDTGQVAGLLQDLKRAKLVYEKDGAAWLKTTELGDDKDRVIRRSDGAETYLLKDLAYHREKIARRPSHIVTLVGADHFAEAKVLAMIIRSVIAPQNDWDGEFVQPIIQFVRLIRDGREVSMSKRAGAYVTIDDLFDEINPDVARFFFLLRDLDSHMDFDLSLAKEQSEKNPVFYVQYAYVRAKHIMEKHSADINLTTVELSDDERLLAVKLLCFPLVIDAILKTWSVHQLAHYAIEVSRLFHRFYARYPVLQAAAPYRDQRLVLTAMTSAVLTRTLSLMGISRPDRMVASEK